MPESTDTSPTRRLMADRYGVASPRRRVLAISALAVGAAVMLAWLAWAAWVNATGTVSGEVVSFEVVSVHRIDVTVDIHRPANSGARCTLDAQAVDHAIVGHAVVTVAANGESDVQVDTTIKTDREATTATVSDCR